MLAHERRGVEVTYVDHGGDLGVVPHLRVDFAAYFALVDELIAKIARRERASPNLPAPLRTLAVAAHRAWEPDQVVAITFGGVVPGRACAQALRLPLAYLGAERYAAAHADDRRKMDGRDVHFARDLLVTSVDFGRDVLLVDDLTDEGRTFQESCTYLMCHPEYGGADLSVFTACLWRKIHAMFAPTYHVDDVVPLPIPDGSRVVMPWIDQPLEVRYAVPVEEIAHRAHCPKAMPQ